MYKYYLLIAVVALSLHGCGSGPKSVRPQGTLSRAQTLEAQQAWAPAAELYRARGKKEHNTALLLHAAELFMLASDPEQATATLNLVSYAGLERGKSIQLDLLWARMAMDQGAASDALALLTVPEIDVPANLRARFYRLRAEALFDLDDPLESAAARSKLDAWLEQPEAREENQQALFTALRRLPMEALTSATSHEGLDENLRGWLSFTLAIRRQLDRGEPVEKAVLDWRQSHPDHPAGTGFAREFLADYANRADFARHIALILPLRGRYSSLARQVRDGFMAAYFFHTERPLVRIYAIDPEHDDVGLTYQRAVENGAQWVVGPLLKESLDQLFTLTHLPVPVLALNQVTLESGTHDNLFQMSLSPEQEASDMAGRMYQHGRTHVLVLTPEDSWGDRVGEAFAGAFSETGGAVVAHAKYAPDSPDHGSVLRRALALDKSKYRAQRLSRVIGMKIASEEERRDDIDAIYLTARSATQARLIRPQIRFHRGSGIPVYANSRVYSGKVDRDADRDMNGVLFCDSPWILNETRPGPQRNPISALFPAAEGAAARMYAFGIDSFQVLPYLSWLERNPDEFFPGTSGDLSVGTDHKIRRQLSCARFEQGRPVTSS